ncbi:outer membrane beta-barrel protein [Rhizobiaceae bacterium]|nr:outer membrane beta-barrel protein [Rhizobiaceae bacterium]
MRIILAAATVALAMGQATAADLDQGRFLAESKASASDWRGTYVGAAISHGWVEDDDKQFAAFGVPVLHSEGEGAGGGAFAGFMMQHGRFVAGVEYEYQRFDMEFEGDGPAAFGLEGPLGIHLTDNHAVKLRAGIAFDRILPYATAGIGHARVTVPNGGEDLTDTTYVVGAGVDFKLTNAFVVGLEYKHTWFEDFDDLPIDGNLDTVSLRVAYKF